MHEILFIFFEALIFFCIKTNWSRFIFFNNYFRLIIILSFINLIWIHLTIWFFWCRLFNFIFNCICIRRIILIFWFAFRIRFIFFRVTYAVRFLFTWRFIFWFIFSFSYFLTAWTFANLRIWGYIIHIIITYAFCSVEFCNCSSSFI